MTTATAKSSRSRTKQKEKEIQEYENMEEEVTPIESTKSDMLDFAPVPIDQLSDVDTAIKASDVKKLKEVGIFTVQQMQMMPKKQLLSIKGISEAKVDKLLEVSSKLSNNGFMSGTEALDEILDGGIETRSTTEIFGEFRTGKSQLLMTLAVTAQLSLEDGGGAARVCFIDTEGTFRPERILSVADRFGLDGEAVLDNMIIARAYNTDHLMDLLVQVAAAMAEKAYALLIIDSIMSLFRIDYQGRGELSERQQKLNCLLGRLMKIAETFNVAIVYSNHVQATPDGAMSFAADPKKPIGGHVLSHASVTRLMLKKGKGEQRFCKIFDSPLLPEADACFYVTESGVCDEGKE